MRISLLCCLFSMIVSIQTLNIDNKYQISLIAIETTYEMHNFRSFRKHTETFLPYFYIYQICGYDCSVSSVVLILSLWSYNVFIQSKASLTPILSDFSAFPARIFSWISEYKSVSVFGVSNSSVHSFRLLCISLSNVSI